MKFSIRRSIIYDGIAIENNNSKRFLLYVTENGIFRNSIIMDKLTFGVVDEL